MFGIRCFISCLVLLLFTSGAYPQNLLDKPESISYDSVCNRYFVSNVGDGTIITIDSNFQQSYFYTGFGYCAGNHILGNTLFVSTDNGRLVGIDLTDTSMVLDINLSPLNAIDGITADTSGFLYVCDTGGWLIKVDPSDGSFSNFAYPGVWAQDCTFDAINNRVIVGHSTGVHFIKAVSLADGTVTTVVSTGYASLDGIASDDLGNIYTSSYAGIGNIVKYRNDFTGDPEVISSGHDQPAGLCYNVEQRIIAVPNFDDNTVDFIPDPFFQDEDDDGVTNGYDNCPLVPNPDQGDIDGDSLGNVCDNCEEIFNPEQEDDDSDGAGNECDICPGFDDFADVDDDLVPDSCDNCPDVFNPEQIDLDDNGIGDVCDYICGDADGSRTVDIDDVVFLVGYIFAGGNPPDPIEAGDADCSGGVDIDDVVYLIAYIFSGGPEPCAEC